MKTIREMIDEAARDVSDPVRMIRVMRWHDASAELPASDVKVLCLTQTKNGTFNYVLGYYAADLGRWVCGMNSNVKYWMDMPVPPWEEAHDER